MKQLSIIVHAISARWALATLFTDAGFTFRSMDTRPL